jgi:hypothetical protein
MVDGKVGKLFRAAVELRVPKFNVWLRRGEAHGIATGFSLRVIPDLRVFEAFVEACVAEDTEGKCGEYAGLLLLIELVG